MAFSYENIPDALLEEAVESHFGQFAMERKSQFYNFVCPFCGDMNRPNKKKAYVYKDTWLFKCFKCGISQHIMKYLKENDDAAYGRILMSPTAGSLPTANWCHSWTTILWPTRRSSSVSVGG